MKTASLVLLALLLPSPAFAACPAGQSEMLTVRLYFGQTVDGKQVPAAAWRDFLARSVTPKFPDGFTVSRRARNFLNIKKHRFHAVPLQFCLTQPDRFRNWENDG